MMSSHPLTWREAISQKETPLSWWESWEGDPNDGNSGDLCPLLFAAWDGNAPLMQLLIAKGADPARTYKGKNLVHLSLESQETEAIVLSLSHCGDLTNPLGTGKNTSTIARPLGMEDFFQNSLAEERLRRAESIAKDMDKAFPESDTTETQRKGRL